MGGKWRECTLGELTENFDGVRRPVREADRRPGPYPYYGASGIVDHVDAFLFDGEYLLIAEDGENLRTRNTPVAFLARGKFWVNNHAHIVRGNTKADTRFLMYALSQADIGGYLTGSAMPKLTQGNMNRLPLVVPPLSEQRAIAHVLGTLDEKIELNRRRNATLEAMARALFKAWFVDFEPVRAKLEGRWQRGQSLPGLPAHLYDLFPDRLVDSELDQIPEGWLVKTIGDLADLGKGLSYKGSELADEGGLPMINLGCFLGNGQFKPENIKRYKGEYQDRHLVRHGDLLIANTDVTQHRLILGSPAIVTSSAGEQRYLFTHHTFAIRFRASQEKWKRYVYFSLLQPEFREIAEGYATGTTVLALPRDGVLTYPIALPPEEVRAIFERYAANFLAETEMAEQESRSLAALRNTLLPKLISGELRVSEAMCPVEVIL